MLGIYSGIKVSVQGVESLWGDCRFIQADWEPFIYYVITFLGFLDPPPPLRNHVFSTENNQKLPFSAPPSPPTSDYVVYE